MNHLVTKLAIPNISHHVRLATVVAGTTALAILLSMNSSQPSGWLAMWGLAVGIFGLGKVATLSGLQKSYSITRSWLYLLTWPGMDAAAFHHERGVPVRPTFREWFEWSICVSLGMALLLIAPRFVWADSPNLAAWFATCGIVLTLHFGFFGWLSGIHRTLGINAVPIMDHPSRSASLAEFWGRRWNRAFRDLSHRFLFRPFAARLGAGPASFLVFLFSGIVHDLVISIPASGGYGGPTLFFLAQWLGLTLERTRWLRPAMNSPLGLLWTALFVLLPLPLLAHEPFRLNVILPMLIDWRLLP